MNDASISLQIALASNEMDELFWLVSLSDSNLRSGRRDCSIDERVCTITVFKLKERTYFPL